MDSSGYKQIQYKVINRTKLNNEPTALTHLVFDLTDMAYHTICKHSNNKLTINN